MAPHLTASEREVLSKRLYAGHSKAEIARSLRRDVGTIYRELNRNSLHGEYSAVRAQEFAEQRHRAARSRSRKMNRPEIRNYVFSHLKQYWSPDQIAGRLKREFPNEPARWISAPTVYKHLHGSVNLWAHFRQYLRGTPHRARRPKTPHARTIAARPDVINRRERVGDWEGDTIHGPIRGGGALLTLVERRTGYLELGQVRNLQSDTVMKAAGRWLKKHPASLRLSCTFDNGPEFSNHLLLHEKLQMETYLANPGCPWQRGTNEHTNRLLRQFFPKGMSLRDLPPATVARVAKSLNDRPRKRLGYATPSEAVTHASLAAIQT